MGPRGAMTALPSASGLMAMASAPFGEVRMSPAQIFYITLAQRVFILNMVLNFLLYYMPPFKYLCGGDGDNTKFPCSISWMTRKGLPRYMTFGTWLPGWACLLHSYSLHEQSNALAIQIFGVTMFATGFVTCILTPIREDVAMGQRDTIHCIGASIYIVYHILAYEWVLGVDCFTGSNLYGLGLMLNLGMCGTCQYLRMNDNRVARALYESLAWKSPAQVRYSSFLYGIELLFAFSENALFFIFLLGMTSGSAVMGQA